MKGEQFIAEVKNLAELDSNEEAQKTVRATLETLREAGRQRAGRLGRPAPARDCSLRRGDRRPRGLLRARVLRASSAQGGY